MHFPKCRIIHTAKCLKAGIAVLSLSVTFFFTGWVLNWGPFSHMLEHSGFYSNLCSDGSVGCPAQQVAIAKLWSAVMLSEFTIFPSGLFMDMVGPLWFSIYAGILHCGSTWFVIVMSKCSPFLVLPFFGCGAAAHASALIAMRTVFIFDTPTGRSRWILICVSIFDSSAVSTMIYYNLWERNVMSIENVFKWLSILGMVLFGSLPPLYAGFLRCQERNAESNSTKEPLMEEHSGAVDGEKKLKIYDIVSSLKFYFTICFSCISIYRIRYFLGIAKYILQRLHDDGFYLQALGYCFCLSVLFAPIVDRLLRCVSSVWSRFHLVNFFISAYFVFWLIPILPVQLVTFALFIFARLLFFVVINEYCCNEFTKDWFGSIIGLGFVVAAIPGSVTYLMVDLVLKKFNSNFYLFHIMCMLMAIPVSIMVCFMKRHVDEKTTTGCVSIDEDSKLGRNNATIISAVKV